MTELERSSKAGGVVAAAGDVLGNAVRYGIVIAQLTAAAVRLAFLGQRVRSTYDYVEGCSDSVDRLADQMASLTVDQDTVTEHREAATVMRSVLSDAESMATATEELSTLFDQTASAHQSDYGSVAEAANAMPVPMAEAEFYSNR